MHASSKSVLTTCTETAPYSSLMHAAVSSSLQVGSMLGTRQVSGARSLPLIHYSGSAKLSRVHSEQLAHSSPSSYHTDLVSAIVGVSISKRRFIDRSYSSDPYAWTWLPGLESLLYLTFVDRNTASHSVPLSPMWSEVVEMSERRLLEIWRNEHDKVNLFMRVYYFACQYSDYLDTRRFVLGMRLNSILFIVCDLIIFSSGCRRSSGAMLAALEQSWFCLVSLLQ